MPGGLRVNPETGTADDDIRKKRRASVFAPSWGAAGAEIDRASAAGLAQQEEAAPPADELRAQPILEDISDTESLQLVTERLEASDAAAPDELAAGRDDAHAPSISKLKRRGKDSLHDSSFGSSRGSGNFARSFNRGWTMLSLGNHQEPQGEQTSPLQRLGIPSLALSPQEDNDPRVLLERIRTMLGESDAENMFGRADVDDSLQLSWTEWCNLLLEEVDDIKMLRALFDEFDTVFARPFVCVHICV